MASDHNTAKHIMDGIGTHIQSLPPADKLDTVIEVWQRVWGLVKSVAADERDGLVKATREAPVDKVTEGGQG